MAAHFEADFAAFGSPQQFLQQPVSSPTPPSIPDSFALDENKLSAADPEKKELYLFQWLSSLERDLRKADKDTVKAAQANLEKTLLKYLTIGTPKPTRPIRQLIARCFVVIYSTGDTRTLFDTLAATQAVVAKKVEDPAVRIAAIHSVGVISETHGGKLLSLFPETASSFTKIMKNAKEAEIALRYETTMALTKALRGAGRGATEVMIKDFLKIAKNGLADKVPLIRTASAELMEAIYKHTSHPPPLKTDEYETVLAPAAKALDGSNYPVRRAVASLIATILGLSQSPPPVAKTPAKKPGKPGAAPETTTGAPAQEQYILTVEEMLSVLSSLCLKGTTREMRIGVIEAYAATFKRSGIRFVETNYALIVKNIVDLASHPKMTTTLNDTLLIRELAGFILREVVGKMLTETGQANAVKELGKGWLRKWPAVLATDVAPSEFALVCVLNELAALLVDLGPAAVSQQEAIVDPLVTLLAHPSRAVNVALAWCLRCLCTASPNFLPKMISKLTSLLQKESGHGHLNGDKPDLLERFIGYGNVLEALISVVPKHNLFVSFESMATVFGLCTQLLKSASGSKDLRAMAAQAQVAWTLIGSLMCLGPNFVKIHISQLLLIWKNVFPKPSPKESGAGSAPPPPKTDLEWNYILVSRGSALAALHSFLVHNIKDLASSSDVAKRIVVSLNNTLSFLPTLPAVYPQSSQSGTDPTLAITPQKLTQSEHLLRKRLFQCYAALPPATYETTFSILLRATMDAFAPDPDKTPAGPPGAGAAHGAGPGVEGSIVTSFLKGLEADVANGTGAEDRGIGRAFVKDTDVQKIENLLDQQTMDSLESDPHLIYITAPASTTTIHTDSTSHRTELIYTRPLSPPASTGQVDAAIELFALLVPLQNAQVQETTMEQMIRLAKYVGGRVSPARKRAVEVNVIVAVIGVLKYAMVKKGGLASGKVGVTIRDLVEDLLTGPDAVLRALASETLGRLCRVVGSVGFVNPLVQNLVDQVVKNRDPDCRAGAALALGCIHSYVGGMAASSHLKTIVGILHSLASDPHPLVHTWALHSLWLTIESAGLMYGPYVNSSLSVIAKLFMTDSHEPTAALANVPGGDTNQEVYPAFGRILHALVGVVGPELQSSTKVRDLCFSLYNELKNDDDPFAVVEAIRCIQHFILFAPKHVDIASLMPFLQMHLGTGDYYTQVYLLRKASVTCLYQLSRRDAGAVLASSVGNQLEEQLFALLDTEVDGMVRDEIKDVLGEVLTFVAPGRPS
ncbi:hypothetical protein HK104_002844, partial [Borealophlyctis nickersoniae]